MNLWYWLISHSTFRCEIDKTPAPFLFDVYKQKSSQENERNATLDFGKREFRFVNLFPDLSQFAEPEPLELRDSPISLKKDLEKYLGVLLLLLF